MRRFLAKGMGRNTLNESTPPCGWGSGKGGRGKMEETLRPRFALCSPSAMRGAVSSAPSPITERSASSQL